MKARFLSITRSAPLFVHSGCRSLVVATALLVVLATAGCGKILGVDEYSVSPPDAAASGAKFLSSVACVACLENDCPAQIEACANSKACSDTLACRRGCSDPGCHMACVAKYQSETDAERARDGAPSDPGNNQPGPVQYDDLIACAFNTSCHSQCELGRNFACVGKYSPRQRPTTNDTFTLPLDAKLYAPPPSISPPISNMKVSACGTGTNLCDPPLDSQEITDGLATLRWTMHGGSGHTGWLELENDGTDAGSLDGAFGGPPLHTKFVATYPFVDGTRYRIILSSQKAAAALSSLLYDAALGPEDTSGYVQLLDCDWQGPPGVELGIFRILPNGQRQREDHARITYWNVGGIPDLNLTETDAGGASVTFLPNGGPWLFEATEKRTGRVVARSTTFTAAGWGYQLYLYPLTESDARALGD